MMPRFVISMRERYDHGHHRTWQGIDTGFGLLSQFGTENTAASTSRIVESVADEPGGIQLKVLDDNAYQV